MTERIAVVGGGVSGLVAAYLLRSRHDVTVFEAGDEPGGHVNTVTVEVNGRGWPVDTGFIVYNERNYPLFTRLLRELDVATRPSTMSFSVRRDDPPLEYNGSTLRQLFVQRSNLFRPSFHRMLRDVLRFNREAPRSVAEAPPDRTLGDLVEAGRYSSRFVEEYLVPMGAAIWSTPAGRVLEMPAGFFVRFFEHHGMLTVDDRPQWRTIVGGSRQYVERLTASFGGRLRTGTAVQAVRRFDDHVEIDGEPFDRVVLACHSDQALAVLVDPSPTEREILSAIPYQRNAVLLHTDTSVLPRRRAAWAAWNYHLARTVTEEPVGVTYNMNILQGLDAPVTFCVTLNDAGRVDDACVHYRTTFSHPQYSAGSEFAQRRWGDISGVRRTHYCGAYWGNGFHEDGVRSAVNVASELGSAW